MSDPALQTNSGPPMTFMDCFLKTLLAVSEKVLKSSTPYDL